MCKQPETSIPGSIFRGKKGRKCRNSRQMRHFCARPAPEPDQCATGENTKKSSASAQRSSCFYASNKGSGAACSNPSCRRECETGKNGARSTRNKGKNTSKEEKNKQKKTWNLAPKNWLRKQFFSANFATSDAEFRRVRFSVVPFSPKNCCPLAKNCTLPPKKSTLISNPYPVSRNVQSYEPTGHWRIGDCFGFFEIYRER